MIDAAKASDVDVQTALDDLIRRLPDGSVLRVDVDTVGFHRVVRGQPGLHRGRNAGVGLRACRGHRGGHGNNAEEAEQFL